MSTMLKGLKAIMKAPGCADEVAIVSFKKERVFMSREGIQEHCDSQISTVVKMRLDGFEISEISQQTSTSKSFVSATIKQFGLVRKSMKEERAQIKDLIMNSAPYTYKASTISKVTGIDSAKVSKMLGKIPQIERGVKTGLKFHYRYNFDIKIGDGVTSRGFVG